ncbi:MULTISPECIES: DNA-3-methyladenine glycosylase [Nocardioides]|uniref:Putative 3-methyladenine DNA glycosylase n=1 Tax=Nocardioides vastitatis TaxID=2568655 RepID=A0ABW0ZK19_9ACTN|nr:DNA-3-methyladenine glycosylase [Nocardioides sp.]THJ04966.1 DNA-3-methyladenine glycosylase [Nocardioides sp.]
MPRLADQLSGPPEEIAPRLLGAVVRHGDVAIRLTEVEAYAGTGDPGSHAHRGRGVRNATMFGPAGRLYCYLSHGIHICANVTVGEEHGPGAVLMRAGEVVDGVEVARERRAGVTDRDLARGPGRLGRALGLVLGHDGTDLETGVIRLELPAPGELPTRFVTGPRTGLRLASDRHWRYWLPGEPTVSPYRRHPRAEGPPAPR